MADENKINVSAKNTQFRRAEYRDPTQEIFSPKSPLQDSRMDKSTYLPILIQTLSKTLANC